MDVEFSVCTLCVGANTSGICVKQTNFQLLLVRNSSELLHPAEFLASAACHPSAICIKLSIGVSASAACSCLFISMVHEDKTHYCPCLHECAHSLHQIYSIAQHCESVWAQQLSFQAVDPGPDLMWAARRLELQTNHRQSFHYHREGPSLLDPSPG